MKRADIVNELVALQRRLKRLSLIESGGASLLGAISESIRNYSALSYAPWTYTIERDRPLAFRQTDKRQMKYRLTVDLYGQVAEPSHGIPRGDHSITVRVWAHDKSVWFDPELDNPQLERRVAHVGRRVMMRFRFDAAQPDDHHPWFHLQIGGQQVQGEFCRLHDNLGLPRFIHHPMNLIMACEFIVRAFYPEVYYDFWREPSVRSAMRRAQAQYLRPYFDRVASYPEHCGTSFLGHMWEHGGA